MWVGWRRLNTESAGVGKKRLWLTDLHGNTTLRVLVSRHISTSSSHSFQFIIIIIIIIIRCVIITVSPVQRKILLLQQHTGVSSVMSKRRVLLSYLNEMLVDPFSERLLLYFITLIYNTSSSYVISPAHTALVIFNWRLTNVLTNLPPYPPQIHIHSRTNVVFVHMIRHMIHNNSGSWV